MTLYLMRLIDDTFGMFILRIIGFFIKIKNCFIPSKAEIAPEKVRYILCQKYFGMGSILNTIPIMKGLRQHYPNAKIIFITLDSNKDLIQLCEIADEVLCISLDSFSRFIKEAFKNIIYLLRKRIDISIDFEYFAKFSLLVPVLIMSKIRVGLYLKKIRPDGILMKNVYYNHYRHISEIYFAYGEVLGIERKPEYFTSLLPSFCDSLGKTLRKKIGLNENKPIVAINVNAGSLFEFRKWPAGNFVKLIKLLINKYPDNYYVMIGEKSDFKYVKEILEKIKDKPNQLINCAGQTSIKELFALIEMSYLFITNDSGPLHIASLYHTNIAAFFGPESPVAFGPLNKNSLVFYLRDIYCSPCLNVYDSKKSLYGETCLENKCLINIKPEKVFEMIEKRFFQPVQTAKNE